jgi:predicted Zn-dependent peptidase
MKLFVKNISGILLMTVICLKGFTQNKPAYEMTVNGIKVIVQPSGNEIVQVLTVLKGGVQNYPADKAGIEDLAMTAILECGTKNDSKNSFKNKLDKISAYIGEDAGLDFSTISLNCIKSDLDQAWPLYVDAITVPLFDSVEFDRMKQDDISSVNDQASAPDFAIAQLGVETAFKGKDYAKSQWGTEETLRKMGATETKNYYTSVLTRSRLLIVVVAELDKEAIEKLVKKLTDNIPEGKPVKLNRYNFVPSKNTFTDQNKAVATNYILGITAGPQPGSEDYNSFVIAMRIYAMKNFVEIRTNNGLSYAPSARFISGLSPYTQISVTTKFPDKFIAVNNKLLDKTHTDGFSAEDVKNAKTGFVTSFYSTMETNSAQAASLAANEILFNDWHRSIRINEDMKKVSSEEVSKSFNRYVKDFSWVYQGDTSKVNPSLYTAMPVNQKLPETKVSGNKN